ncbi:hypothetical protein QBC35DRAFT_228206 [Podospora australis]|uniref:Proteophosphoglycan ppg4 n=1 Tax=Podospora australis TaxID=1536484 RepID=A0AAN7AMI7_9PEZI|nr:hypothetical protein QBC35DRAFT_228206 [Podospora australis]
MGNAQSAEQSRKPSQKLSKPKTNNHATAGLLSPSGSSKNTRNLSNRPLPSPPPPSPPAVASSTASSVVDAQESVGQRAGRSASFHSITALRQEAKRRSIFRSRTSQGDAEPGRRDSVASGRKVDMLGNRANSLTYESAVAYYGPPEDEDDWSAQPHAHTSWNYNLTSYEAKRLLNLVEEPALEHATTLSENHMTVVSETTWRSSNPTNPPSVSITRANSDVSLYMPVRRRSIIQTPGVATRASSMRSNIAPPPRFNVRYSHPPTPSLSRQQSFESYRSGIVSMPPRFEDIDPIPRAVTPREEDYLSIGAFKLGSLRITNGAASPSSPEIERKGGNGGLKEGEEGYFARPQASGSRATAAAAVPPLAQSSEDTKAPQPHTTELGHITTTTTTATATTTTTTTTTVVSLEVSDYTCTSTEEPKKFDSAPELLNPLNFTPLTLDLPSPFGPELQTTSKHTALEDELFEDDGQLEYSSLEILDVRLDPNAKSPPVTNVPNSNHHLSRTDSGFMSTGSPSPDSPQTKPLTKADSGYSSNVSLRSFQTKSQGAGNEKMGSLEMHLQPEQKTSGAGAPPVIAPLSESAPPPVPPKDLVVSSSVSPSQSKSTPTKSLAINNVAMDSPVGRRSMSKARHSLAPIQSLASSDRGPASPQSMPRTPASAKSSKSDKSSSAMSIGSKSQRRNRLQRLLSSARRPSAGPLEAHATHALEKNGIPSIPREVEHKLNERAGLFPLTTKRLALKPKTSMDTLKTIFSVGSVEASLDAVNTTAQALPTASPIQETAADFSSKDTSSWRQTFQSMPTSIAHVAAHMKTRKTVNRKPVPVRPESAKENTTSRFAQTTSTYVPRSSFGTNGSSNGAHVATLNALAGERGVSTSPQPVRRAMSLVSSFQSTTETQLYEQTISVPPGLASPLLPSPLAKAMSMPGKTKTPPPVSMSTRRQMSLRVPPPLRSQSSTSSLNRKTSRESIQSYPAAQPLARQSSRESIHSYPSCQQMTTMDTEPSLQSSPPTMDPRRLMSFRQYGTQPAGYKTPRFDLQPGHHDLSRQSSYSPLNGSRRSSFSSNPGQEGYGIPRPISAQAWHSGDGQQQLRHRASYDGYGQQRQVSQHGYPPSMSNGYTAPSKAAYDPGNKGYIDTANTWSRSQLDAAAGQWYQAGPPPMPRNHNRKRSMSAHHGPNPPYRVLHSYNSPAYRNAPIWG